MIVGESGKQEQKEEGVSGDGMWPCWWGIRVRNSNPSSMPPPDHRPPHATREHLSMCLHCSERGRSKVSNDWWSSLNNLSFSYSLASRCSRYEGISSILISVFF
jgi:hypothetical protein